MNKASIKNLIDISKDLFKHNRPEIMMGIGITGMITTTVLAVKATPKALMLIEERKLDLDTDELSKTEIVKCAWKCYIPTTVVGSLSVGCLVTAMSASYRRNAAIATACAISETTLKEYQAKVLDTIGSKKEQEIRDEIAHDKIESIPVNKNEIIVTGKGDTLCIEPYYSGQYFYSDIEKIKRGINEINEQIINNHYASLNDLYEKIGMTPTEKSGNELGWNISQGIVNVHYSSQLNPDGVPCLVINFINLPTYDYDDYF